MYSHHGGTNPSCNFFTNAGRNGVLPQGFDQFFENVNTNTEKPNSDPSKGKIETIPPGNTELSKLPSDSSDQAKQEPSGCTDEDSSFSNSGEEKGQGSGKSPTILEWRLERKCISLWV